MTLCQKTGGFGLPFLEEIQEHNHQSDYLGDIDNIIKYIHQDGIIVTL